jgi:hypothetical protein
MKAPALAAGSLIGCPRCGKSFALGGEPPAAEQAAAKSSAAKPAAAKPAATQSAAAKTAAVAKPAAPQSPASRPSIPGQANPPPRETAPTPPTKKAIPVEPELAVVCRLCGTRMHVKQSLAGTTIRCPDCTTENVVKQPVAAKPAAKGPSLDDAVEFELDEVTERPKYRPLVQPRGQDEILGELGNINTQATSLEGSLPKTSGGPAPVATSPATTPAPASAAKTTAVQARPSAAQRANDGDNDEENDDDFQLAETFERPAHKPLLPEWNESLEKEAAEARKRAAYDRDSYGDELWNQKIDPNDPNAWKKSPFLVGVVTFLFHMDAIPALAFQSIAAAGLLLLAQLVVGLSQGRASQLWAILLIPPLALFAAGFALSFGACCLAIAQDTANGMKHVANWPGWNFDWIGDAFTVAAAGFVASLPGVVLGSLSVYTTGQGLMLPLLMLCSGLAFFPIVLFSMLAEGTISAPVSRVVLSSFSRAGDGWMLFYMESFVIGLVAAIAISITPLHFIGAVVAAVVLVALAFIYFRLLGRLMWYCEQRLPAVDERE